MQNVNNHDNMQNRKAMQDSYNCPKNLNYTVSQKKHVTLFI